MSSRPMALAVDGDPKMRRTVCRLLERLDYETIEAESATEAIARLLDTEFELVVTDLCMPLGADGFEVVRAVRKSQPTAAAIMLTGQGSVADCAAAMRAGANDFVTKPFHPDALVDVIRGAVENMRVPRVATSPTAVEGKARPSGPSPAASLLGSSTPS